MSGCYFMLFPGSCEKLRRAQRDVWSSMDSYRCHPTAPRQAQPVQGGWYWKRFHLGTTTTNTVIWQFLIWQLRLVISGDGAIMFTKRGQVTKFPRSHHLWTALEGYGGMMVVRIGAAVVISCYLCIPLYTVYDLYDLIWLIWLICVQVWNGLKVVYTPSIPVVRGLEVAKSLGMVSSRF